MGDGGWPPLALVAGGLAAGLVVPLLVAAAVGRAPRSWPTVAVALAAAGMTPLVAAHAPPHTLLLRVG